MLKKIIISIYFLLNLILFFNINISAESYLGYGEIHTSDNQISINNIKEIKKLSLSTLSTIKYNNCYGDQLTGLAKNIYDKLVEYCSKDIYIGEINDIKIPEKYSIDNLLKLDNPIQQAKDAFVMDYPKAYWIRFDEEGSIFSYSYNKFTGYVLNVSYEIIGRKNKDIIYNQMNAINSVVNKILQSVKEFDVYDKLKYFHNVLIKDIQYDKYGINEDRYNIYGAFIGNSAVCEGYAKAFKLLCNEINIPCTLVVSKTHMWNYVKMNDNSWYAVDVTQDDPIKNGMTIKKGDNSNLKYDYFLVGSDTNINGTKFSNENVHIEKKDFTDGRKEFVYPNLSKSAYPRVNIIKSIKIGNKKIIKTKYISNSNIKYISSNQSVLTISSNGTMIALKKGVTTIIVSLYKNNNYYTFISKVNVI